MPTGPGDEAGTEANLDVFFYDTTPGGAGFAAIVTDRLRDVLSAARLILRSCNCNSSCQRCLRTYDNRYDHLRLDRFLASSLLEYMETGVIPPVEADRRARAFDALAGSVRLLGAFGPSLSSTSSTEGGALAKGGKSVSVVIVPALIGGDMIEETPSTGGRSVKVSELVLTRDLPRAATAIFDLLE